jgi:hypothetical protein
MPSLGHRIVAGISITVAGAFVWAFLWLRLTDRSGDWYPDMLIGAAYGVFLTSWFVLPMGVLLGLLLPRMVRPGRKSYSFLIGALLGVACGLAAAALTTLMFVWPSDGVTIVNRDAWLREVLRRAVKMLATMIPLCAVLVGVWALRLSAKANNKMHPTHPSKHS